MTPEERRAYYRRYYYEVLKVDKAASRKRKLSHQRNYLKHREKKLEYAHQYYAEHREQLIEYARQAYAKEKQERINKKNENINQ